MLASDDESLCCVQVRERKSEAHRNLQQFKHGAIHESLSSKIEEKKKNNNNRWFTEAYLLSLLCRFVEFRWVSSIENSTEYNSFCFGISLNFPRIFHVANYKLSLILIYDNFIIDSRLTFGGWDGTRIARHFIGILVLIYSSKRNQHGTFST